MSNTFTYTKLTDMTVGMQSQQDRNLQVLHGKVLLNEEESRLLFMQTPPRGPRSKELMRTQHSRLVVTPKGGYTLTFRFSPLDDGLQSKLEAKMREVTENDLLNINRRKETL